MRKRMFLIILLIFMTIGVSHVDAKSIVSIGDLVQINQITCSGLFGSASDPNSLRNLINYVLQYPRIIVPIIVIGLGSLDLAKAVVSSKPDEMKKAQKTFFMRLVAGIVFFLVPTFVNIVMWLADIVWNGMFTTCGI